MPQRDGERELRSSVFLPADARRIDGDPEWELESSSAWETLVSDAPRLDVLQSDPAPRLQTDGVHPGGTRIFSDQAVCPFRAFARHRLAAESPEEPFDTIHPIDRGRLFHEALVHFWRGVPDHASLRELTGDDRTSALGRVVERAARRFLTPRDDLPVLYRRLERERVGEILEDWVRLEEKRTPFTVEHLEQKVELECGGVTVRMVIDRVDTVTGQSGASVVIDYKTGRSLRPDAWFEERPEEPQLPLYCLQWGDEVVGVVFGGLHRARFGFVGTAEYEKLFPKVDAYRAKEDQPATWKKLHGHWRRTLTALGEAFAAGDARVDPKHPLNSCARCDLHALCRIGDRRVYPDDTEEWVDEEEGYE